MTMAIELTLASHFSRKGWKQLGEEDKQFFVEHFKMWIQDDANLEYGDSIDSMLEWWESCNMPYIHKRYGLTLEQAVQRVKDSYQYRAMKGKYDNQNQTSSQDGA